MLSAVGCSLPATGHRVTWRLVGNRNLSFHTHYIKDLSVLPLMDNIKFTDGNRKRYNVWSYLKDLQRMVTQLHAVSALLASPLAEFN